MNEYEFEIKNEVIKYQEQTISDLEQQVALLQRTILKQKETNQKLYRENHDLKLKLKKKEMETLEKYPMGYNPFQE